MRLLKKGFTLIELLVVIAIIALLLSIIMPAFNKAKELAAGVVCLSNESQLIKAYILYSEDNDSLITDGYTASKGNQGMAVFNRSAFGGSSNHRVHCWVGEPEGNNENLDDKIRGFEMGSLWAFLESPKVYNCPADKRWRKPLASGPQIGGYRSYSIGKPLSKSTGGDSGEIDAEITKMTQFVSPDSKIVFLEETEKEYGWNNKTWNMRLTEEAWVDPFAVLHNGSSTFAYADGHAGRYKWLEETTIEMAEQGSKSQSAKNADGTLSEDYIWFRRAYIPGRMPSSLK